MDPVAYTPGTVSRILWHFTGGPLWNDTEHRQSPSPKSANQAFENLKSILKTRELRLGGYKEVIRVRFPEVRKYNPRTEETKILRNVVEELSSSPVCCLADVPIIHLAYLAPRYGKFAIGFHREAVVKHGFNPVLYILDDAESILSTYRGLGQLNNLSGEVFKSCGEVVQESVAEFIAANGRTEKQVLALIKIISQQADFLDESLRGARDSFKNFLGLVKTFSPAEFGTIYCEREWRSFTSFKFNHDDVAMVVLPRTVGKGDYFQRFCESVSRALHLPATIPIVLWEDLIEH